MHITELCSPCLQDCEVIGWAELCEQKKLTAGSCFQLKWLGHRGWSEECDGCGFVAGWHELFKAPGEAGAFGSWNFIDVNCIRFPFFRAIRGLLKLKLDLLSCKSKPQTRQKLWSPQGPAWQRHSADCKGRVGHPCSCAQRLRGFWPWHLGSYASLGGLEGNFVWLIGPFAPPPPWQAISDDFAPPGHRSPRSLAALL